MTADISDCQSSASTGITSEETMTADLSDCQSPSSTSIASEDLMPKDLADCQSPLAHWFSSSNASNADFFPQQTLQASERQQTVADQSVSTDVDISSANS